jgi:DNA (cytosine-5)-methyltransferase 1
VTAEATRTFDFQSSGQYGEAPIAATLSARDYKSAKDLVTHPIAFPARLSGTQHASTEDVAPAMGALNPTAVAYTTKLHNTKSNNAGKLFEERSPCLDANSPAPALLTTMAVRRLTPVECERLQGFRDNYTLIPWRTYQESQRKGVSYETLLAERGMTLRGPSIEECPHSPRYKALGNSWAVPVARWIGHRIQNELRAAEGKAA